MKKFTAHLFKDLVLTEKPKLATKADIGFHPGQVVRTSEGAFRVEAKSFSTHGVKLRLASFDGSRVLSKEAGQLSPMAPWESRIATMMVFASAADWNEYINHFVVEAGFPVDPDMDWNAWFNMMSMKYLKVPADDPHAESAIHNLIVLLFVEQDLMSKFTPERLNAVSAAKPIDKQISQFLKAQVGYRMDRLNEAYVEDNPKVIKDDTVSGDAPIGDEGQATVFDAGGAESDFANPEELAQGVEENAAFSQFRDAFVQWVGTESGIQERTVKPLTVLFDLILVADTDSGSKIRSTILKEFEQLTGKSGESMKDYCRTLASLLVKFAKKAPKGLVNLPIVEQLRAMAPSPSKESSVDKELQMSLKNKLAALKAKYEKKPVNKWAKMQRIAEEEPEEGGSAAGELAMAFAGLAEAADALAQNLGHSGTEEAGLSMAAKKQRYAKFRQIAFDNPGSLADALQEMYNTMDTVAEGIENLAQNLGVELSSGGMGMDTGMGMGDDLGMGGDMGLDPMDGEVAPSSPDGGIPVDTEPAPVEEGAPADMAPKASSKRALMASALKLSGSEQVKLAKAILALNA